MPEKWIEAPFVILPLPPVAACPHCGHAGTHIIVRSTTGGDGSITRRCVCRACAGRFVVIVDPDYEPEDPDLYY